MHLPRYHFYAGATKTIFEFVSEGPKGYIHKLVEYSPVNSNDIYNLGFGDVDELEEPYNDMIVSNNGDSAKVLATVAATVFEFTQKYPKASVLATGSTKSRTRLYRMNVNRYLHEIQEHFVIFGYCKSNSWEEFNNKKDYEAFLLTRIENRNEIWLELQTLNLTMKTVG
ncbi:DUF6934 family protein [Dyadobacter sp. OTU695]|uniref:DUF6934 family protein n=1 Tax=Dyadobacter sp. OTU695 TaxID=3043860 RepID=UPI00313B2F7A